MVYNKGTEKSPLGNGVIPEYDTREWESDERERRAAIYMVGYAGVNVKRWVRVHWLGFKQT